MTPNFVQSMRGLHTWGGLVFGWILFAIFLTGTLAVFDKEITHWMRPELHGVGGPGHAVGIAERLLERDAGDATSWHVSLPNDREPTLRVSWQARDAEARPRATSRVLDPATGRQLEPRETAGGEWFYRFHYSLTLGGVGAAIVGVAAMVMLVALISGVVIHARFFKDFFTFRPRAVAYRAWLDAHNVVSVLVLPFHVMITYTGLTILYTFYMPAGIQALYGGDTRTYFAELLPPREERTAAGIPAPTLPLSRLVELAEGHFGRGTVASISVRHAGDAHATADLFRRRDDQLRRVTDSLMLDGVTGAVLSERLHYRTSYVIERVMAGLHYVQFGTFVVRWLYFVMGLASTAMIGTGLILWTLKRLPASVEAGSGPSRGMALAERLNIAAMAGILVAIGAFFWANRLLPVDVAGRALWEVRTLWLVWAACAVHASVRSSPARAWEEQLVAAAALLLLLPVLNIATTDSHLFNSLARHQWTLVGVDVTAAIAGVVLGVAAWRVHWRRRGVARAEPSVSGTIGM